MAGIDVVGATSSPADDCDGSRAVMPSLDIAVVIVTYKTAQLTIDSLRSVDAERSTAGLRIRAVVVDNASGDLPAIADAVAANNWSDWVTCVLAPINGGFAFGNNLGIRQAHANGAPAYVHLLNPDAQLRRGAVGSLVQFMEAHPDVGIAGGSFENLDGSDWPFAFRFPSMLSELDSRLEVYLVTRLLRAWVVPRIMTKTPQPVDWVCGASMMIRASVFAAIGGLDENYFLYFEETDFCYRAKQAGYSTWYVPESRVMHIGGQSTQVTERNAAPKRMPHYWFESRRRYFAVTQGVQFAMIIDIVALFAHLLGWLKRILLLRTRTAIPYFLRDLARHSVLWRRNRDFPTVRSSVPRK
jgi:N-acetylglucosaminyl-diphospho-decaprenol L-rhamnosyltransferase